MKTVFPILTANEAANLIQNGEIIGVRGLTPAGSLKIIPAAIAQKAIKEHQEGRPF